MPTWPPGINDDGTNTTGTVLDKAYFDAIKAYVDAGGPGTPLTLTGAASTGTFTFTSASYYTLDYPQRRVFIDVFLSGATISAGTTFLYLDLPAALPAATVESYTVIHYWNASPLNGFGMVKAATSPARRLNLTRDMGGTQWPAASGVYVLFQFSYLSVF